MTNTVLNALTLASLTALANEAAALVAAEPRKSFPTKSEAIARIEKHLEAAKEADNAHTIEAEDTGAKLVKVVVEQLNDSAGVITGSTDTTSEGGTKVTDIAKERKSRKGVQTARAGFKNEHFIRVLVEKNPKRAGSPAYERFSHYKDGMTVAEFCASPVGRRAALIDLAYDVSREFVLVQETLSDDFKTKKEEPTVAEETAAQDAPESTETENETKDETQEAVAA